MRHSIGHKSLPYIEAAVGFAPLFHQQVHFTFHPPLCHCLSRRTFTFIRGVFPLIKPRDLPFIYCGRRQTHSVCNSCSLNSEILTLCHLTLGIHLQHRPSPYPPITHFLRQVQQIDFQLLKPRLPLYPGRLLQLVIRLLKVQVMVNL